MTELLTAAQMRAIERAAIEAGEVTGLELMERAGRGVVDAMLDWRPELARAPHRAVVLCGPGNNGGDGFVVARLLKERGWEVEVFLYGRDPAEIDKLPPDAAENARRWREMGEIRSSSDIQSDEEGAKLKPHIFVDALFGTGLTRPVPGDVEELLYCGFLWQHRQYNEAFIGTVSVDMPSGACSDSGRVLHDGICAHANLVVTFHAPKVGHYTGDGCDPVETLRVVDIGLADRETTRSRPAHARAPDDRGGAGRAVQLTTIESYTLDKAVRGNPGPSRHKYDFGHALVLSGGVGKGGAARMAARGALRIGAGLVTVGCPPAALQENASALDAVMLAAVPDAAALREIIAARKVNAVCIGPGFGRGERLRAFVAAVLGGVEPRPTGERGQPPPSGGGGPGAHPTRVVLDADAISEYRDDPEMLFGMLHPACVLTPHEGEFGRLFPDLLAKLKEPPTKGPAYSKVDATREAAARAGCVVLFKGPDTVIADPEGRCAINSAAYERAAPWLATAGSGDVLAGFITGLLARGFGAFEAAETAAWLHVECAREFGPGLIAEDLPEQLPAVFRKLGL